MATVFGVLLLVGGIAMLAVAQPWRSRGVRRLPTEPGRADIVLPHWLGPFTTRHG